MILLLCFRLISFNFILPVMKPLSLDLYKYLYRFSGAKDFSYYFALLIMTSLHVVVLNGLSSLLSTWYPFLGVIHKVFSFPICFAPGAVIFFIGYKRVPYAVLSKEKQILPTSSKLLIYFLMAVLIIAYSRLIK